MSWAIVLSPGGASQADSVSETSPHGPISRPCSDCHTSEGWQELRVPLAFDHGELGFPLEQGHRSDDCTSCHQTLVFSHVPTACADCHLDTHRGEFGDRCSDCHTPADWQDRRNVAEFHDATLFPLTGSHRSIDCQSCHREAPPFEYTNTPTQCVDCHLADYQATRDPDHLAAGFPTDCQSCHGTRLWQDVRFGEGFDHDLVFPLIGMHAVLDCSACHADGFAGTPTDCFSCHQADYANTTDPDHEMAGFSTMCESCHTPESWFGADFDHDQVFALTGAHRDLDCDACHANGVFTGTPTDCFSCHQADYDNTNDPNHRAAGFPTMCESCHNTVNWDDADFDHLMYFPIERGNHAGLDCAECHVVPSNFQVFECIECHEHERAEMADEHDDVPGYVYESSACYECHPTGTE